jgi:aminoacrylate hydrolase
MLNVPALQFVDHQGCRLAYRVRGDGAPVVWIQGVGVHGDAWQPQVETLCPDYRCLTFDNRGIGQSRPCARQPTVPLMAADALALMDAEGLPAAHVVGHSLGGLVALHLALSARNRVRSLALFCTFARGRSAARSLRMLWIGLRTVLGTARMRRRAFLQIVYPPALLATADRDALAARLAPVFGHDLAVQPPVTAQQLRAMRAYDATQQLPALGGLPTLVVSAEHDPIAPPHLGRCLAAAIPGARLAVVRDAAHGVMIQCAGDIDAMLREHWHAAGNGE